MEKAAKDGGTMKEENEKLKEKASEEIRHRKEEAKGSPRTEMTTERSQNVARLIDWKVTLTS